MEKKLLPLLYASATRLDSIPRAQIVTLVPIQTAGICVPMYALTTLQLIDKVEDGVEQNYLERFSVTGCFSCPLYISLNFCYVLGTKGQPQLYLM